jgi:DNA mismatch repair protein MutL
MGKINVLSFEIANLIAAGEVVERPSSVIKELIENSIDSGATSIVCEIKRGGVSLIRVTDNGCGIAREDLPVALKRHATSKIKDKDDLGSINTLGFRGEALAAISSVSKLTIITKTKEEEEASMLVSEAGVVSDISEVGASDGTTVVVTDLFYNVPARRKFLKKDHTEAMNVCALVEKVALSKPDISIQLIIDGEQRFKTPGDGDVKNTIYAVLGKDFSSKLIPAEGNANGIRVSGFIGRSDNVRKNRNLLNVFINGRYVKSLTAQAAIEKAYTSYIAPEAFPCCVLFIEMNPSTVDVNVHPAKLEVKFQDERTVFETVYYTVKAALESYEYRPEMELGTKNSNKNVLGAFVSVDDNTRREQITIDRYVPSYITNSESKKVESTALPRDVYKSIYNENKRDDLNTQLNFSSKVSPGGGREYLSSDYISPRESRELLEAFKSVEPKDANVSVAPKSSNNIEDKDVSVIHNYKYIGEAFDCYVMIEYEGSLLIIDKHAAHERVIFEDLKRSRKEDGRIASQSLMLPISVLLSPDEQSALLEYAEEIKAVGFDFQINNGACDLYSIPGAISASDAEALLLSMVGDLVLGLGKPQIGEAIRQERALYQIACKGAIKGGRIYDRAIIDWLINKLLDLPDITVCPHGRPVAYKLTKSAIDRQFERLK